MIPVKNRTLGLNFQKNGTAHVTVWAPFAKQVELELPKQAQKLPLQQQEYGYWTIETDAIRPGDRYNILLDSKTRPDPASLSQPEGVHKASEAVHLHDFDWQDSSWRGIPLEQLVIYELHVGTFTKEGTFQGIISKLDYLHKLGVNAIELMPVAQFPGERNWGYDGVYPYAVQKSYGGVKGLQQLVNACHQNEIAVVLDVVYNHLGPEGNYLNDFGPYFTDKYKTPWGSALNFDDAYCDGVRRFWLENALMWFRDFHVDMLRLDAVHAIKDFGATHFLKELKECTNRLSAETGRLYQFIAECDLNDTRYLNDFEKGGYSMDSQWSDEFHHALHALVTGETRGYYEDFGELWQLEKAFRDAYVYDGIYSPHRNKTFGNKATDIPGRQFVAFIQNHDQVGNRMLGDRLSTLVSFDMLKVLAGALFVSPYVPMLFMGEEYGETNPFLYFVSHTDPALVAAVRKGRKAEFAAFHDEGEAPDPQAVETFQQSNLSWKYETGKSHQLWQFYQRLIHLRKTHPVLSQLNRQNLHVKTIPNTKCLILERWTEHERLFCLLNFGNEPQAVQLPVGEKWQKLLDSSDAKWGGLPTSNAQRVAPESIVIYTNTLV